MFDPIFNLVAGLLAWFYSLVPSYGFAIIALTTLVLVLFSPLTYKSTKSLLAQRQLQPQVKKLQKKYKGDREKMNQELMALYQEHGVTPLSGCLPILIQSPIFLVMFRVFRGITRRTTEIGFSAGFETGGTALASELNSSDISVPTVVQEPRIFNPENLDTDTQMYMDLRGQNEMNSFGLDLALTPLEVLGDGVGTALPYLIMIAIVAFLGWFQQRQIAGRQTGEVSQQQQIIMKVIPWMLPIFAFTMPAALVLYFMVSSTLRVIQQGYLTRTVYSDESLKAPIDDDDDDDEFDDDDDDDTPENPLTALLGGGASKDNGAAASERHGSRRPVSAGTSSRNRARPPKDAKSTKSTATATKAESRRNRAIGSSKTDDTSSGWGKAKRSARVDEEPAKPVSKRVTQKGETQRPKKK